MFPITIRKCNRLPNRLNFDYIFNATVYEKMGIDLKSMPYVNVPVDGWSENIYKNIKLIVLFLKFKFLVRLKLCIK